MTEDKPAYILVDTKITDPVAYEDYKAAANRLQNNMAASI